MRASARETYPRSTPIGYAVRPNPIAATEEKDLVGKRSGTRPFLALVVSQNQLKVRVSTVSRKGSVRKSGVGPATAVVLPVLLQPKPETRANVARASSQRCAATLRRGVRVTRGGVGGSATCIPQSACHLQRDEGGGYTAAALAVGPTNSPPSRSDIVVRR